MTEQKSLAGKKVSLRAGLGKSRARYGCALLLRRNLSRPLQLAPSSFGQLSVSASHPPAATY